MSRRYRFLIALIGVVLVGCSLAALAYAFWPIPIQQTQITLAPTLFSAP